MNAVRILTAGLGVSHPQTPVEFIPQDEAGEGSPC